ncbi:MAG TPA: anaerobic glycerol-3-phosphate dehydrogenase subunit B [Peptococcaceae bacterium]|nr:anaerobic glycerol-3-phosphate dehydrogenase subunit B [Peptococcaceae bacterium]
MKYDVVVIGSGMSGLVAAAKAVSRKRNTLIITKGQGMLPLTSGCIDLWGYQLDNPKVFAANPFEEIRKLVLRNPKHPYAKVLDVLPESVDFLKKILQASGYFLIGNIYENRKVLTALGTERITALIPPSMVVKEPEKIRTIIAVGFKNYLDFFPEMFLDNLKNTSLPKGVKVPLTIDLGIPEALRSNHLSYLLERKEVLDRVADEINGTLTASGLKTGNYDESVLVVFPAVLGRDFDIYNKITKTLAVQVIEVPGLPPSIPGQRLNKALISYLRKKGAEFYHNSEVTGYTIENGRISSVAVKDSSNNTRQIEAESFILATGSFMGGGLLAKKDSLCEPVFKLPVVEYKQQDHEACFLTIEGMPFLNAGLEVDGELRPLKGVNNLYAVGSILAHSNYAAEKSGLGVALSTGYKAASLA